MMKFFKKFKLKLKLSFFKLTNDQRVACIGRCSDEKRYNDTGSDMRKTTKVFLANGVKIRHSNIFKRLPENLKIFQNQFLAFFYSNFFYFKNFTKMLNLNFITNKF